MTDRLTLIGTIGTVPERRTTSRGEPWAKFRLACSDRVRRADGSWGDGPTSWYEVNVFGSLAANALDSVSRGDRVIVTGDVQMHEWQGQEGKTNVTPRMTASGIGHDLKWGTSRFSRARRDGSPLGEQARTEQSPTTTSSEPERDLSATWPMALDPASGSGHGELVGAAAAPDDTPF